MPLKRKRAPGGGRKPKGAFSKLTSPLSLRMPSDMRDELEAAAKASGKSVSQELLRRLQEFVLPRPGQGSGPGHASTLLPNRRNSPTNGGT